MLPVVRNIIFSQLLSYAGLLICVLLKPTSLDMNAGVSYFGIYRETFVPYAFGLLGGVLFLLRAAEDLPEHEPILKYAIRIFALLTVGIVATPYTAGRIVNDLHVTFGTILFSLQLTVSCWLVWRLHYIWWSLVLILVEFSAGLLSAMYLEPGQGLLLQTEVLFQLAFGGLLVLFLHRLHLSVAEQKHA